MNFLNFETRLFVYMGMFGSGKTELAINTAIELRKHSSRVALVDIDVISPYFRSRDERDFLKAKGIEVIAPPGVLSHADLPIITAQMGGYISNSNYFTVADVGGNEDGATVLGSVKQFLDSTNKTVFFVVNTLRPFSTTIDEIAKNVQKLSEMGKVKVDYLVCNTNIGVETSNEDIRKGEEIVGKVSEYLEIPVAFTAVKNEMNYSGKFPIFRLKRYLVNLW